MLYRTGEQHVEACLRHMRLHGIAEDCCRVADAGLLRSHLVPLDRPRLNVNPDCLTAGQDPLSRRTMDHF